MSGIDALTTSQKASVLVNLASQASEYDITSITQNFPSNWSVIETLVIQADQSGTPMPVQCILSRAPGDPADPSAPRSLVLALGINWALSLRGYVDTNVPRVQLDPTLDTIPLNSEIDSGFQTSYTAYLRRQIWALIKTHLASNDVLYIAGIGLGSPLAQLAALDFRPGHIVAGLERSQYLDYQPECYVFSAPNIVNESVADSYNTLVVTAAGGTASYTYQVINTNQNLTVDFFPTAPDAAATYFPLGTVTQTDKVTLPPKGVDTGPWLERGNNFYLTSMDGTNIPGPQTKNQDIARPAGYDPVYAHALAELTSATYQFAQHPTSSPSIPSSYSAIPNGEVKINGVLWARAFTNSNNNVIVVIRGTTTWQEYQQMTANTTYASSQLVRGANVHKGISDFYYGLGTFIAQTPFKDAMATMLTAIKATTITLCGHDVGGALANLIALDLTLASPATVTVANVYVFGTISVGDFTFMTAFNASLLARVYNVRRIYDKITQSLFYSAFSYYSLGTNVIFDGQLSEEENTFHAINGYAQLLSPFNAN
jgi:hypothetical protein